MSQKPCAQANSKRRQSREHTPTQSRGRATQLVRIPPPDTFQVVIQCGSEAEQERLYDEFRSRNLSVRLLTM